MSNLFIISAPSGAGKTSMVKNAISELSINLSVSYTTRAPRIGEIDGLDYFFIDNQKFDTMIEKNEFYEHAEVFGNRYGTSKSSIDNVMSGNKDVILEIDWQGALLVKQQFPSAIWIFIVPPSISELRARLQARQSNTIVDMDLRLAQAKTDLEYIKQADYIIINENFELACSQLNSVIVAEMLRGYRQITKVCDILGL